MMLKSLLYNSVTVSLPKNVVQFVLGVSLFWIINGAFDAATAMMAMCSFLLAYSSVYFLNDIVDCESDRRDREKRGWKLVANGRMSRRTAWVLWAAFLSSGMALSFLVNGWFVLLLAGLIFLNFMHSSPYTRLKKRMPATAVNMTAIEFLKYSSGWFALTGDLAAFPFWIVLTFALIYSVVYIIYKFDFRGKAITSNKTLLVPLGLVSAFAYLSAVFVHDFALPMVMLLGVSVCLALLSMGRGFRFSNWLWMEFVILPIFMFSFLMLMLPPVAQANDEICSRVDVYKEIVYEELPPAVAHGLRDFSEPPYSSLDEVQSALNRTLNFSEIVLLNMGKHK